MLSRSFRIPILGESNIVRFRAWFATLFLLIGMTACSSGPSTVNVVVTTGMIADAVKNVGGADVRVTQIIGAGVDPHHYVATDTDQANLANAAIIFYNGLHLEAQMVGVLEGMGKDKPSVPLAESIPADKLITLPGATTPDPHVWGDVTLWEIVVGKIRDELSTLDTTHAADYKANADAYLAKLQTLDQYIHDQASRLTPPQNVLVTAHDGFRYFGRAYGLDVFAPQNSSADPASPQDIQTVLQAITSNAVTQVFAENTLPQDTLNDIISGAQTQGITLQIAGTLDSDSPGKSGDDTTYDGMMRHNIDTIVTALLGLPAE